MAHSLGSSVELFDFFASLHWAWLTSRQTAGDVFLDVVLLSFGDPAASHSRFCPEDVYLGFASAW